MLVTLVSLAASAHTVAARSMPPVPPDVPPTGTPGAVVLHVPFGGSYPLDQPFGCTGVPSEPPAGSCAHFHTGVDWELPAGTPVLAAAGGTVVQAGLDPDGASYNGGYGDEIVIDHGAGIDTLYGHLSQLLVQAGDHVVAGQLIALSGGGPPSGPGTLSGNSSGPHLHFGVEQSGTWIDPVAAIAAGGVAGAPGEPTTAPVPTPAGAASSSGGTSAAGCGWTDPACWFSTAVSGLVGGLMDAIGSGVGAAVSFCLQPLAVFNVWSATPPELTTEAAPVQDGWRVSALIADALAIVFLLGSGLRRMLDAASGKQIPPLGAHVFKVIWYLSLLNLSLPLIAGVIAASNDVVGALGVFSSGAVFNLLVSLVLGTFESGLLLGLGPVGWLAWLVIVVLLIVKLLLLAAIFIQMLYRLAALDFAIVAAPLALFARIWEPTEHWGRKWNELFWTTLIQQYFQVLLLHAAFDLSGNFKQWSEAFMSRTFQSGLPPDVVGGTVSTIALFLMQTFLALVMMLLVLRLPRLLNLTVALAAGLTTGAALMGAPYALAGAAWRTIPGLQSAAAALGVTVGAAMGGPAGAYMGGHAAAMAGGLMFGRAAPFPGDHVGQSATGSAPPRHGPQDVTPGRSGADPGDSSPILPLLDDDATDPVAGGAPPPVLDADGWDAPLDDQVLDETSAGDDMDAASGG